MKEVPPMDLLESNHAHRVLSSLNHQRALGRFCDAILGLGSGQVYLAHRNVLACFSQLFQDASTDTPCMEVCLPEDCTGEGLELLLNFIYTGELQLDHSNLEKVRSAAGSLSVPEVTRMCQEFRDTGAPHAKELVKSDMEEVITLDHSKSTEVPKSRPKSSSGETLSTNASSSPASHTTTTRSGRRVKGPRRLLSESSTLSPLTSRKEEPGIKEEGTAGTEGEARECEQPGKEMEIGQEEETNEHTDEEVATLEDTDEEYVPHTQPDTSPTSHKAKHRGRGRAINKENGETASRDTKKASVQCPTCHKTFLSKYYLKVHNRRHTGEKPFECSKCGKCYFRKENLLEHEARNCQNRSEVVFSCTMCPMTFQRRLELRLHTVTHTGEMPNKCTSCSEQFMQKKDLKIHLIKVHGAPKPHACPLCPKCFLSRTELRLHEAAKHRGEKLFVCEECGHRASSRNGLQMHIKAIHRNERPYVCEFCSRAFTQKANLNMHLRTHTGERPFQCHLCGKTFRTQASLDKHHRTHTGERPFGCEFCQQRFTEKGPLMRHVASKHQEGRPHYCHICSKTFKAVEQLRVHVRRHKGMRKFECRECGYKFTRQSHLRRHSQIHNRVENYNPRQRRLRNLVVEDEKAGVSFSTPTEAPAHGDIISVMMHSTGMMVEEVVSTQGVGPSEEEAGFTVAEVMEQTLLVPTTYSIQHHTGDTEDLVEKV